MCAVGVPLSEQSQEPPRPGSEVGSVRGIGDVTLRQMPGRDDLRLPGEFVPPPGMSYFQVERPWSAPPVNLG